MVEDYVPDADRIRSDDHLPGPCRNNNPVEIAVDGPLSSGAPPLVSISNVEVLIDAAAERAGFPRYSSD